MQYLLCRLKVADFERWKRVFDSHADAHKKSGLRLEKILRNIDQQNEVFTLFEVTDLAKARGFVTSPEAPGAKEASGVIDNPDVYFLS